MAFAEYTEKPQQAAKFIWRMSGKENAANGAVMRTAVIGLLKENVAQTAEDVCKLTHYDSRCISSCVIISEIISRLIWHGEQLSYQSIIDLGNRYDLRTAEYVKRAYQKDIAALKLDEPASIGYTLKTLGAALWCLFHSESFEDGLLSVVNEGGDADTNAAVACAVLGAKFGYDQIPTKYVNGLIQKDKQKKIIEKLIKVVI